MTTESEKAEQTLDSGGPKPPAGLGPGTQLGKYRLERVLGSGGMGVVWLAKDPDLERDVAIKLLHSADAGPALRTRLLREARAMARLKHPNVLTVYEVGSDGDRDYIAMELVEGANLDAWLSARPPEVEVWDAILAAGRGLAAAHAAGLVHRDFKPHNVLRSRDGRVLVTDFGLARGAAEDADAAPVPATLDPAQLALDQTAAPTPSRKADAVLDSTLTQPGQLIGTPAYMAPEQYLGASPDPRTDQFAFCVTAWQAFTGARPFEGKTIDDMRRAALAGVAHLKPKLPSGVRPVLVRGLAAKAEARWPDLDALLAALERSQRRKRWIGAIVWSATLSVALFAAIAGVQILFGSDPKPPAPPAAKSAATCAPADEEFADAWTPARKDALAKRYSGHPAFARTAAAFDGIRSEWTTAYDAACRAPASTTAMTRLSCLLGERDELAIYARLLETLPANAFERGLELGGVLPRVAACSVESPVAPPALPDDRKLRDRIVALRVRLATQRLSAPAELGKQLDELLGAARAIGWRPLEAEIYESAGVAAQITGDLPMARTQLEKAAGLAEELHDYRLEAMARIALYEVEADASTHPAELGRGELLAEQARAAVRRAGDDPLLSLAIELIGAAIHEGHGRTDRALAAFEAARARAAELVAPRQLAIATAGAIRAHLRTDDPAQLAAVWQAALAAEQSLAPSPAPGALANALVELAWRRNDLAEAHARADQLRHPLAPADAIAVHGRVVDVAGKPIAGASVIAWRGELVGDAERAYIRGDFEGDVATTDASGAFTVRAPPDGALVAEHAGQRSLPVRVAGSPTLALTAARTLAGSAHVHGTTASLDARARFEVAPNATWVAAARVDADGGFSLGALPASGGILELARAGRTVSFGPARDHAELTWPHGPTIDVIVSAPTPGDLVYMLRGHHDLHARAELHALAAAATGDVAILPTQPVGLATGTEMGAHQYKPGDTHALVADTAAGEVTACVAPGDAARPITCAIAYAPANGELAMALIPK